MPADKHTRDCGQEHIGSDELPDRELIATNEENPKFPPYSSNLSMETGNHEATWTVSAFADREFGMVDLEIESRTTTHSLRLDAGDAIALSRALALMIWL
jgi:hypothetical protein